MKKFLLMATMLLTFGFLNAQKIADVQSGGKLQICDLTSSNYKSNCKTVESSGVSNVQMSGDSKIIITYENGKKKACEISSGNYTSNCKSL